MEEFGLELTNNSKTSWAFSMPRSKTCVQATEICRRLCYGNGVRYQTAGSKAKRERNFRTVEFLLEKGGPELLARNLVELVDRARPLDWLAASIVGGRTKTPWSVRVHDVGDFGNSIEYVTAWKLAMEQREQCFFWFYTRSFAEPKLFETLTELASLPNCKGWLSIDSENFSVGLKAFTSYPKVWRLALMQEKQGELDIDLMPALKAIVGTKEVVSFPVHRGKHHVEPISDDVLFTCPAVVGIYKLEGDSRKPRPCQICTYCLPSDVSKVV